MTGDRTAARRAGAAGLATLLAFGLLAAAGACAGARQRDGSTSVAVYAPPIRAGGQGRLILLPASPRAACSRVTVRGAALETPDPSQVEPTSAWLTGTWLIDATRDDLGRDRCNSDAPVAFAADGTLRFSEGRGRWRLKGRTFVETITEVFENAGPDLRGAIGRSRGSAMRRVGPDEGAVLAGGAWQSMLRCRRGDFR